jgi:O-acetylhomoserine/O-acetylserine sulfhydrylase-like pyridoxal-dependent enzyme
MKRETIAIHGGFDSDPTTKAVAVPIYQTAAYAFDSAEHGAALFNLEVPGIDTAESATRPPMFSNSASPNSKVESSP